MGPLGLGLGLLLHVTGIACAGLSPMSPTCPEGAVPLSRDLPDSAVLRGWGLSGGVKVALYSTRSGTLWKIVTTDASGGVCEVIRGTAWTEE